MAEVLVGRRVVAVPASIDNAVWPAGAMVLRLAPDDALLVGDGPIEINDPHAIVEPDGGFCALRLAADHVIELLAANASWQLSDERPCLAQGMVAGLPLKVWIEDNWALLICPTPFASELEARLL